MVLRGARREGGEEDDVRRGATSRRDDEYECDAKRGGAEKRVAANEDMVDRAKTDAGASAASARGAEWRHLAGISGAGRWTDDA